jgi:hypothetical protein
VKHEPDADEWEGRDVCLHGNLIAECEACDQEIEERGGIDKCMNCGRYMYGDQLSEFQVCKRPCRNPNEY